MTDIKELKNTDGLVDINDISVDKDLPKSERIKEYIRQIKNPYRLTAITLLLRLTIYTRIQLPFLTMHRQRTARQESCRTTLNLAGLYSKGKQGTLTGRNRLVSLSADIPNSARFHGSAHSRLSETGTYCRAKRRLLSV